MKQSMKKEEKRAAARRIMVNDNYKFPFNYEIVCWALFSIAGISLAAAFVFVEELFAHCFPIKAVE
jgi:hypothetical protein